MPKSMIFWVVMLLWLIFGLWGGYGSGWGRRWVAGSLLIFVLLFLLGWQVFGLAVQ
jgi:hypothetical protein